MELLKRRILTEGQVLPGNILKVDSFLNHQLDIKLLYEAGKEIALRFKGAGITKILTVEASGIALAALCGLVMEVPVVFAKKHQTSNLDADVYSATVESFTHGTTYNIRVSKKYLASNDRVLIVDDFLANGRALLGLTQIVREAGAELAGAAIAIEKGFQGGGDMVRRKGIRVESLVIIDKMDDEGNIKFRD
ncbi:MAG TPA: xanthine phosphoribosyltransferase [Clostridiales bacterium]|nr:xanthine phosphoribosyltransferase [Clostridiales bacterium]